MDSKWQTLKVRVVSHEVRNRLIPPVPKSVPSIFVRIRSQNIPKVASLTTAAGFRAQKLWARALLLFLLVLLNGMAVPAASQQPSVKNVLVLYGAFSTDHQYLDICESLVRARVPGQVTFYVALMDTPQGDAKSYQESLAETLRRQYAGVKLDLVIAIFRPALRFAVQYREKIFPGVPIVFTQITAAELDGQMKGRGVTGVSVPVDFRHTIELALNLHPDTNAVAVVTDSWWLEATHSELLRYRDKVKEIDLVGPPDTQLLERVAALPPHTVVLFQLGPSGSKLSPVTNWDVLRLASQRLPTYSPWPSLCLNHGCIGGAYPDPFKEDQWTAELAARVLLGEGTDSIPIVNDSDVQVEVDWRQIRRWHIPESALAPGTTVLYREPSLWERGRSYFLAGIAVIVVQTLLIFGLLWQRARKRKTESVLRESEKRFRVMADTTPSLIWMCDAKGKVTYLNEQRLLFTGSNSHAGYGDSWTAYVHPDDLNHVQDALSEALKNHQPFSKEYRLRRADGVYRWMFDVAAPRVNGDGSFAGFIGSATDVSDQKLAREALETVSGQLIAAQEKERSRLARELHDDICQRLAMISLKIEKVTKGWGRSSSSVPDQLEQIWQQCSTLTGDVQALSHELHPSILYNLGLATAVKSFCREVSEQNDAVVDFVATNIPRSLPREVSLSLFRVAQEALHNAVKYSGRKYIEVRLQGKDGELELEVSDKGVGFDPVSIKNSGGLGLVSMAERIHQVNGTFRIDSQPSIGTLIQARVPLSTHSRVVTVAEN
jgi:PAS domain S-box-containing protein